MKKDQDWELCVEHLTHIVSHCNDIFKYLHNSFVNEENYISENAAKDKCIGLIHEIEKLINKIKFDLKDVYSKIKDNVNVLIF